MPNDRAAASLLKNIDLKKYPKLKQFLSLQSLSETDEEQPKVLSNKQALDLLEEAIGEVEEKNSLSVNTPARTSRQKELDSKNQSILAEKQVTPESLAKAEQQQQIEAADQDSAIEQKSAEKAKNNESAEIAEIGQELTEIKEFDKEKADQESIKKQQATINNLATQAQAPSSTVKPVVVLPITETQQKLAKKKNTHFSLRWLAEWADKIRKIFAGAVLYKEEVENSTDV
jgi:hypothetical protein